MNLNRWLVLVGFTVCFGCGDSETPVQPSVPSGGGTPSGTLAVQATLKVDESSVREAVAATSEVSVEASTTGATGAVTYSIDFGDGAIASGPAARHVYPSAGAFTIRVEGRDAAGRSAGVTQQLSVVTISGALVNAGFNERTNKLEVRSFVVSAQDGAAVRGVYRSTGEPDRPFVGTLSSSRTLRISVDGTAVSAEGTLPERVSEDGASWPLRMRGDSVDGQTLAFRRAAGSPDGPGPDAVLELGFGASGAGMAMVDLTFVSFDGRRSRGTDLSYFIEFGDGQGATGPQATHQLHQKGPYNARLTVVDRFGRSDAETLQYWCMALAMWTGDSWGGVDAPGEQALWLQFHNRQGLRYDGIAIYNRWERPEQPVVATVSGDNQVVISLPTLGFELRGTVFLGANDREHRMNLLQAGGAGHGRTWTFRFDDGPG